MGIKKVYYTLLNTAPIWYGFASSISKNIMFMPVDKSVFRITINADSLEVYDELGYFRDNYNYDNGGIVSTIIINPSNSTDWTIDPSCSIKYVGIASVYQYSKYASAVLLDKFDFNFKGEYCNPPINFDGNKIFLLSDRMIDESVVGGKMILSFLLYLTN